jgi:NitT/TauT family transport system substrate-binding protein
MITTASGRKSRRTILAAAIVAGALALSACGTESGSESGSGDGSTLKVGATSSLSGIGLRLAIEGGDFKKQGLTVTPTKNQTANAAVPALMNGQIQIAQVDTLTALVAVSKGLPIKIVAGATGQATDGESGKMTQASLVAKPDSGIKDAKDLVGKKVAVPAIKTQTWMNVRGVVDAAGGDSSKVDFVEVPPDQMLDLVMKGTVDAADISEPLASSAIAGKKVNLVHNVDVPGLKGAPASVYVTSENYKTQHPDTVKKFAKAVEAAAGRGNSDRDAELKVAQKQLGFKPEQLTNAVVPTFSSEPLTVEGLKMVSDLAVKYGVLKKAPADLASLLPESK